MELINPMDYGQPAIIEHSQGKPTVGEVIVVLSIDPKTGEPVIAYTKKAPNERIGNRGTSESLEGYRASQDNIEALRLLPVSQSDVIQGKPIYSNNARITGDVPGEPGKPGGAPIGVGVLVLSKPISVLEWMPLKEFALKADDAITLAAALRALALLGLLDELKLTIEDIINKFAQS